LTIIFHSWHSVLANEPNFNWGIMMLTEILGIFMKLRFEVQRTSFEYLVQNTELSHLGTIKLPVNDASKILRYFPHLFVIHKDIAPKNGAFFAVILKDNKPIPPDLLKIYKTYFPNKIMIIQPLANQISAKWLYDDKAPMMIDKFLKKEFKL